MTSYSVHQSDHEQQPLRELVMAVLKQSHVTLDLSKPELRCILHEMDVDAMIAVLLEQGGGQPTSRHAIYALMHKVRVQWRSRSSFSQGEQRLSARWLREHGYSMKLDDPKLDKVQED